jgi:hypothetical protein
LSATGAEPLRLTAARTTIPRERFCALASGGKLVVEPGRDASAGGSAEGPPAAIDIAAMDGAKTLIEEACP